MYRVCTPYISKEGVYILHNTVPHAPKEGIPQYHMHQRDDTKGGGLYCMPQSTCTKGGDIPHYHMHQRDDTKGGGLYCMPQSTCTKGGDIPHYHMHQRDDTKGGGLHCMPQCHTHQRRGYHTTTCTKGMTPKEGVYTARHSPHAPKEGIYHTTTCTKEMTPKEGVYTACHSATRTKGGDTTLPHAPKG